MSTQTRHDDTGGDQSDDAHTMTEADVAALMSGAAGPVDVPEQAATPAQVEATQPVGQTQQFAGPGVYPGPGVAASAAATITCPECGTVAAVDLSRRNATDFCTNCDYPLFWARPERPVSVTQVGADDARRRLPGASGSTVLAIVPCPVCAEHNLPTAVVCERCGSSMEPPLPPAPVPPPAPEPVVAVVPPPPVEPYRFPWWWLVASVAILGGIIAGSYWL